MMVLPEVVASVPGGRVFASVVVNAARNCSLRQFSNTSLFLPVKTEASLEPTNPGGTAASEFHE